MGEIVIDVKSNDFHDIKNGIKNFLIIKNESDIKIGDILRLEEYLESAYYPFSNHYSGLVIFKEVKSISVNEKGLKENECLVNF